MTDGPRTPANGQPHEVYLRDQARAARDRARELTATTLRLLDDTTGIENNRARSARTVRAREDLRQTVKAHAEMMRAAGELPERVIIEAEGVINQAVADLRDESSDRRRRESKDDELREDVVRWAIDAYFSDRLRAPARAR